MKSTQTHIKTIAALTLLGCASLNVFAESGNIAGSTTQTVVKQDALQIANADGNMLLTTQYTGDFKNTGSVSLFDNATAENKEVVQLTQGNGIGSGYYTLKQGNDSTVAKWSGTVSTVMKDGNPMTSFNGKWEFVGGSGKYHNIKGKGVYDGYFTSETTSVVNWKGHYSLDK